MKNFYILLLFFATYSVYAGDTLTFRQVYNFNVGDTFDYEYQIFNPIIGEYSTSYSREVVLQKSISTNADTIYYSMGLANGASEQLVITNLDSLVLGSFNYDTAVYLTSDTTAYPGYLSNTMGIGYEEDSVYRFTKGLGETEVGYGYYDEDVNSPVSFIWQLVYYSNGTTSFGTPYYILNGSNLIKYVPLPEQCAKWTRTVFGPPQTGDPWWGHTEIIEQIRTGASVLKNSINYVQLIYSGIDYEQNSIILDSTLGYFYNDSIDQAALIVSDTNSLSPEVLCNFSMLNGQQCGNADNGNGQIQIDTVHIGSSVRTMWSCSPSCCGANNTIIAGIGPLCGLVKVFHYYLGSNEVDGDLTCFNVCGDILYSQDSMANCNTALSIGDVTNNAPGFLLYPSVSSEQITIVTMERENYSYEVYGLDGKLLMQGLINDEKTLLNVEKLPNGMYCMRITNQGSAVQRFIIQH